jgi:hypothetical protein
MFSTFTFFAMKNSSENYLLHQFQLKKFVKITDMLQIYHFVSFKSIIIYNIYKKTSIDLMARLE